MSAYAYTYGDPVNSSDPSGEYTAEFDSAGGEVAAGIGAALVAERKAAEEAAARVVAEKEAEEAAFWTQLMEPKGSELPEPSEPAPIPVYIVNEEEGSYGLSNFVRAHGDPGLPPGAQCEGATNSKKYKKEHKKLCHEIESNAWEPADAFCISVGWTNPFTGYACGAYGAGRAATK